METETLNTEIPENFNQRQTLNNINENTTHPNTLKQTLAQEGKFNVEIMKRIMSEKKTALPSLKNQDWKTIKAKLKKINDLLTNIPTTSRT